MMKTRTTALLTILLFCSLCVKSQMQLFIANDYFKQHRYQKAIQFYVAAIKRKPTLEATQKLADCYRFVKDYPRAEFWYEKCLSFSESPSSNLLNYGQMLKINERYDKAKSVFERYSAIPGIDIKYAKLLSASCDSAALWSSQPGGVILKNRDDLNSVYSDFGVVPLSNVAYVISTNRPTVQNRPGKLSKDLEQPYYKIALAELDSTGMAWNVSRFKFDNTSEYHQATPCFSKNLDTMYYTETRITRATKEKINRLGIYYSVRQNDKWAEPKAFAYNNNAYSVGHPFIANNGSEMYFVSDIPGGFGGFDIYVSRWENGGWGAPLNLGAEINTPEDEFYPVIKDDKMYFSSMGHLGMGGLDLFMADFNGSAWTNARNMKAPINSSQDDFGLYFNDQTHMGFISSNRRGGLGYDDIYSFDYNQAMPVKYFVELKPYVKENGKTIWSVEAEHIVTEKASGLEIEPVLIQGRTMYPVTDLTDYSIKTEKDGYFTITNATALRDLTFADSITFSEMPVEKGVFFTLDIELTKMEMERSYALNNIYYDFNKASLRPEAKDELDKLIRILKDNPTIRVQIGSYCDSRGNDNYNMNLSQRRAQSVVDYLVDNGIDRTRLKSRGYGETKPVNNCVNGVECSEEEHQQNRRTDFEVIELNKK